MTEKFLGKIDFAEFGTLPERPFLMGLHLGFQMSGQGVCSGGKYTVNISEQCRWTNSEREHAITLSLECLAQILKEAKVNYVSELLNKPVKVTIDNNHFSDFRILTEVL